MKLKELLAVAANVRRVAGEVVGAAAADGAEISVEGVSQIAGGDGLDADGGLVGGVDLRTQLEVGPPTGDVEGGRGGLVEIGRDVEADVEAGIAIANLQAIYVGGSAVDGDVGIGADVLGGTEGGFEGAGDDLDAGKLGGAILGGIDAEIAAADLRGESGGRLDAIDGGGDGADAGSRGEGELGAAKVAGDLEGDGVTADVSAGLGEDSGLRGGNHLHSDADRAATGNQGAVDLEVGNGRTDAAGGIGEIAVEQL